VAHFFIDRPIFAWVIALFVMVFGVVSITQLPIAQYPPVAPPSLVISATYPGASARTLEESVLSVIEREMNGAPGLIDMESVAQANGTGTVTLRFEIGSDIRMAQVDVQNRLARATPRLPAAVTQQGVRVDESRSNFLLFTILTSSDPAWTPEVLGDYAARHIVPALQRIDGVGQAQLFGAERAMRIWIDPVQLQAYGLSGAEVMAAIRAQNTLISAGEIGALPAVPGQGLTATVVVQGQLSTPEAFGELVLRASSSGGTVRLRDVARVEWGAEFYATSARLNGQPSTGIGVQLSSDGNALATAQAVRETLQQLEAFFPAGMSWSIPYDSSHFVKLSIQQVVITLVQAVALVFLVMFLFLQNWRYTLIPTIVVPIALLGAFGVLLALGFSINVLTMFGMVLVIGIVVDDAIVVVENVDRLMHDERLSPLDATRKAMKQISGAVIGTSVVLVSVFAPLAFFAGSTGNIYRQFSVVLVATIAFSTFMALSLTPALCATLLKPVTGVKRQEQGGFFGWFNRGFARTSKGYRNWLTRWLGRSGRMLVIYAAIIGAVAVLYNRLPTSFMPDEDQGILLVNVQLPAGATQERTLAVMEQVEAYMLAQPEVRDMVSVLGFSFSGQGQNAGLAFVTLQDWSQRTAPENSAQAVAQRAFGALMGIRDAFIFPLSPPSIPELGVASGFTLRLQDRGGLGHDALLQARNQFLGMAAQNPLLMQVRPDGLEDAPQLQIDIDRDRAAALGVGFDRIASTLGTALGTAYVNDFPSNGRLQRVIMQADAPARMTPDDVLRLTVPNDRGQPVLLGAFASTRWVVGPVQSVRYNGYPAMRISGAAAPGVSSGAAMAEVERLVAQLPPGIGLEWSGQSREERLAGAQAFIVYGFALLAVFLCLAALYESWTIPLAVIMVVPLGVLGVLLATLGRGYENDIYFQIALVAIMGLAAKNAILIIEFAKNLQAQGKTILLAALQAAHMRFRPIVMTSMAFTAGVLPLVLASGAGSAAQRAIGTGVMGGMIAAAALGLLFVPMFFLVVRSLFKGSARQAQFHREHAHTVTTKTGADDANA
jgi:multidrug efflux pump